MNERLVRVRKMLNGRSFPSENDALIMLLVDEIEEVHTQLSDAKQRWDNEKSALHKRIDKLQGVHGA